MRLLSDRRMVENFIESGSGCSTACILEFYLDCKRDGLVIPKKVDDFVDSCLEKILDACNHGKKPKYDDIFNLKFKRGGNSKRNVTKLKGTLQIGFKLDEHKENGLTYDAAALKAGKEGVVKGHAVGYESVKKAYGAYKKISDSSEYEPNDPPA